jgi:hypothetical protein
MSVVVRVYVYDDLLNQGLSYDISAHTLYILGVRNIHKQRPVIYVVGEVTLPEGLDIAKEKIEVDLRDGIVTFTIPWKIVKEIQVVAGSTFKPLKGFFGVMGRRWVTSATEEGEGWGSTPFQATESPGWENYKEDFVSGVNAPDECIPGVDTQPPIGEEGEDSATEDNMTKQLKGEGDATMGEEAESKPAEDFEIKGKKKTSKISEREESVRENPAEAPSPEPREKRPKRKKSLLQMVGFVKSHQDLDKDQKASKESKKKKGWLSRIRRKSRKFVAQVA